MRPKKNSNIITDNKGKRWKITEYRAIKQGDFYIPKMGIIYGCKSGAYESLSFDTSKVPVFAFRHEFATLRHIVIPT